MCFDTSPDPARGPARAAQGATFTYFGPRHKSFYFVVAEDPSSTNVSANPRGRVGGSRAETPPPGRCRLGPRS